MPRWKKATDSLSRAIDLAGMTKCELAERLGVATATVYGWCSGNIQLSARRAKEIGGALGVSPAFLLGLSDDSTPGGADGPSVWSFPEGFPRVGGKPLEGANVFVCGAFGWETGKGLYEAVEAQSLLATLGAAHVFSESLSWVDRVKSGGPDRTCEQWARLSLSELVRSAFTCGRERPYYDMLVLLDDSPDRLEVRVGHAVGIQWVPVSEVRKLAREAR